MSLKLADAKKQFIDLMRNLKKKDQERFLSFIIQEWRPMENVYYCRSGDVCEDVEDDFMTPDFLLQSIAHDIRERIPFDGILPTEHIQPPTKGENSDCQLDKIQHVDEFLYDDYHMKELIYNETLIRNYCVDCGSRNTKHLIFISHSMSRDILYFIFNNLLPPIKGKTVLDIGSRLGAVLYGAYVYTDAAKIIGVEMNKEFCDLQRSIVEEYEMSDRIEILHKKIEDAPEVVRSSDIIIMNNPFEFYLSEAVQIGIWRYLKDNLKKGAFLVTRPSVETMLKDLETGIVINNWLKPRRFHLQNNEEISSVPSVETIYVDVICYEVI